MTRISNAATVLIIVLQAMCDDTQLNMAKKSSENLFKSASLWSLLNNIKYSDKPPKVLMITALQNFANNVFVLKVLATDPGKKNTKAQL